jgi:hypothetical protein
MKKWILTLIFFLYPAIIFAHQHLKSTTFSMACYIIAPDEKWTFKDYGFTLNYKDVHGKKQKISASSSGTKKNCTDKTVKASAKIPAGPIKIHINDFAGEAGSTVECTNPIKYKLTKKQIGKDCEFIVKSVKYGSYTSTDECSIEMTCAE